MLTLTSTLAACLGALALAQAGHAQQAADAPRERSSTLHPKLQRFAARQALDSDSPYRDLAWQAVGPRFCGGRIESIAVPAQHPHTLFVSPGSGNLFRSTDGGLSFTPIFEHEATFAIGVVRVAPSDPDVLWVGTGEVHTGGVSWNGCGVYRSADGGESWQHAGLADADRIADLVLDHEDARRAFASVLAPSDRSERLGGVWRTHDAGESWQQTLRLPPGVGAVDLLASPPSPSGTTTGDDGQPPMFVSTWDRRGGDGSGVYRSIDGGATWQRLDGGLPRGPFVQRVAIAQCTAQPRTVYALTVDARKPGDGRYGVGGVVWRSDDSGANWRRCNEDYLPTYVGWDFCDIRVDPRDAERAYVCGQKLVRSVDGGATWSDVPERVRRLLPFHAEGMRIGEVLHLDAHELWIDPERPDRLLLGNDGGLFESLDGGDSWLHRNTLPIAEFYTVHVDDRTPWQIWGGTQDNGSLYGPPTAIDETAGDPWRHVFLDIWAGGDGFATLPDPTDDNIVYFEQQHGALRRKQLDGRILVQRDDVRIRPRGRDLQFAWSAPLVISAHDPKRLYFGSQHVHVSPDRGDSWQVLGEDLGAGQALVTLAESTAIDGLVYAGARNGRARRHEPDQPGTWTKLGKLPRGSLERLIASRHREDRVFACVGRPGERAGVLQSDDRGASWQALDAGLPEERTRVLLEDPRDERVLYVGTDRGICVTTDGGASWHSLSTTLPTTPVFDLALQVREKATLVAATHGRGVWTVDVSSVRATER